MNAALPTFLQIEPIGRCNLHCRMCPVHMRPETGAAQMRFEDYQRLLDGFPGLRELHLQGLGEPLMHPRFFDMVRSAVERGLRVSTNTNLTLLTPARALQAMRCGLSEISVSVDGATPEVFEGIRVGARLARVQRNLARLIAARERARGESGAALPAIRVVMVLMRANLHQLDAMVHLAHGAGADALFVQRLCHDFGEPGLPAHYRPMRAFIDAQALTEDDGDHMAAAFAQARDSAAQLGFELRLPRISPRPAHEGNRCDWPWRGAYVSHGGEAMPCCMVATPDRFRLGNMLTQGVEAVWNGEPYRRFRQGLADGSPEAVCRSCALYRGLF